MDDLELERAIFSPSYFSLFVFTIDYGKEHIRKEEDILSGYLPSHDLLTKKRRILPLSLERGEDRDDFCRRKYHRKIVSQTLFKNKKSACSGFQMYTGGTNRIRTDDCQALQARAIDHSAIVPDQTRALYKNGGKSKGKVDQIQLSKRQYKKIPLLSKRKFIFSGAQDGT